jgi:hypothetical protein
MLPHGTTIYTIGRWERQRGCGPAAPHFRLEDRKFLSQFEPDAF